MTSSVRFGLALIVVLVTSASAAHARETGTRAGARERRLNRMVSGKPVKPDKSTTHFQSSGYYGASDAATEIHPEIWKIAKTKQGQTLRVYRIGEGGFKEVAQYHELKSGLVIVYPNKFTGHTEARIRTSQREGKTYLEVTYKTGDKFGFFYDPASGHIETGGGRYFTDAGKGLSPARVYQAYMNKVDAESD